MSLRSKRPADSDVSRNEPPKRQHLDNSEGGRERDGGRRGSHDAGMNGNDGGHKYRDPFGGSNDRNGRDGGNRGGRRDDGPRRDGDSYRGGRGGTYDRPSSSRNEAHYRDRDRNNATHSSSRRDRDRSRSPRRDRSRSPRRDGPARSQGGTRGNTHNSATSASRSAPQPRTNGSSAPSSRDPKATAPSVKGGNAMQVDGEEEDPEDAEMRRMMGFAAFRTTKETKVPGNDKNYAVRKEKRMEARQYMNRVGGFNRPLSPSHQ